jgi:5-methylcytosine-specific restriction endonuclease McrA
VTASLTVTSSTSLKDPTRLYGEVERTILFHRQHKLCAECGSPLDWRVCEVHHVEEHSLGGATSLENGAVVHKECHPKGPSATKAFAAKFAAAKANPISEVDAILGALLMAGPSDE